MLKNYLKIALRNIKKYKGYAFINIAGLAVGIAAFNLIALFVQYELNFDRYHENADRIYRVAVENSKREFATAETPSPLAPTLMKEYPEVISTARIFRWGEGEKLFHYGEKMIFEKLYYADPEVFHIFSIPFVKGNSTSAFNDPFSIVMSERLAAKYFGNEDPVGNVLFLRESEEYGVGNHRYRVTGIFKDMPGNSHLMMDLIMPLENLFNFNRMGGTWEGGNNPHTYLLLKKNADPQVLEQKFPALLDKYGYQSSDVDDNLKDRFLLQPLTSIHLDNHVFSSMSVDYDVKYIYIFSSIALLILIIACVNYINLTTARSVQRGKEVGIRKVTGAKRGQLIRQFLGESIILTVIAFIISIIIILLALPGFNSITGRQLTLNPLENSQFILIVFLIVVFVGLFAGTYPAFYVSAFKPVSILNRNIYRISKRNNLRNLFVVIQFSVTIVLFISTFIINNQLNFIKNRDMGYDKDQILISHVQYNMEFRQNIEAVKTELKQNPNILAVSISSSLPNDVGWGPTNLGLSGEEQGEFIPAFGTVTDYEFIDVYGIEIVDGRNFSRDFSSDIEGAVLINETAAKACRWKSPIGKEFSMSDYNNRTVKIVGIVKDFHLKSLHHPIRPMVIILDSRWERYLSIKINSTDLGTLDYIENVMKRFSPNYYYDFQFFGEVFNKVYNTERMIGTIFNYFAFLSIIIACLGLFGLASFTVGRRVKEIGIRKVFGASVANIIALLTKEFSMWMIIANVIAWPLAYFFLNRWILNFAYRVDLSVMPFILSGLAALVIALLTVSYQTIKAARANPVESLKYE